MISRGMETVSKGMQALLDFEDVTAHNLANVTTNGYKKTHITFQDVMKSQVQTKNAQGNIKNVGYLSNGAKSDRTYIDFAPGGLAETGNKMDFALSGDGFFKVRYQDIKPDNVAKEKDYYYQRVGNFKLDTENYLVNNDGDYIMDTQDKRIRITRDRDAKDIEDMNRMDVMSNLIVAENGTVQLVDDDYRTELQKIQVVDFEDKTKVSQIGHNKFLPIYKQDAGLHQLKEGQFSIQQGMIELSNANTINEMINSINVSRGYEAMTKLLRSQSETVGQAISLGNISR